MTMVSCGGGTIPKQTFFNLDKEKQDRIVECAFDEFAANNFENAKLSNIIKNAQIPRGSLYQYFENKTDLYLYLMEIAKDKKMGYLQPALSNPMNIPFLELFKEMYIAGVKFSIDNPRMVQMMAHLLSSKGQIYEDVMKNNLQIAIDMYSQMIDRDKEQGRIRKDVDTLTFAQLVIDMTINVSVSEVEGNNHNFNFSNMIDKISKVMNIFEYGVKEGDCNV